MTYSPLNNLPETQVRGDPGHTAFVSYTQCSKDTPGSLHGAQRPSWRKAGVLESLTRNRSVHRAGSRASDVRLEDLRTPQCCDNLTERTQRTSTRDAMTAKNRSTHNAQQQNTVGMVVRMRTEPARAHP